MWRSLPFHWRVDAWRFQPPGKEISRPVVTTLTFNSQRARERDNLGILFEQKMSSSLLSNFVSKVQKNQRSASPRVSNVISFLHLHSASNPIPLPRLSEEEEEEEEPTSKLSPRVGKKGPSFCISKKDVAREFAEHPFQWRNHHDTLINPRFFLRQKLHTSNPPLSPPLHGITKSWHYAARLSHAAQFPRATIIPIRGARFEKKKKKNFSTLNRAYGFSLRGPWKTMDGNGLLTVTLRPGLK